MKKTFNPDDYSDKTAIHVTNKEEIKQLILYFNFLGKTWNDGTSYEGSEVEASFDVYRENLCMSLDGYRSSVNGFISLGYKVIEFSDFVFEIEDYTFEVDEFDSIL